MQKSRTAKLPRTIFKVTTSNGEDTDIDAFRVKVKKQTVNAKTEDGKTVPFYRFAKGE